MKNRPVFLESAACVFAACVSATTVAIAHTEPLTYETPRWLFTHGDFGDANLDGRTDVAVVDKSTGTVTIGLQRADGGFDWTAPEPTGFTAPTGIAAGRFNNVTAHQLAVTAPAENRVGIFTPGIAASPLGIRHAFPAEPATRSIAALYIDGDGASDLLSVGDSGGTGAHFYWDVVTNLWTPVQTNLWTDHISLETHRIWTFFPKQFATPLVAAVRGNQFMTSSVGTGALLNTRILTGFTAAPSTQMTYGNYDASPLSQVILYTPGQISARAAKVTEPTPGNFNWGPLTTLTFPKTVQLIVTVPSTSGARLAVLYTDTTAATFDFNGTILTLRSNLPGNGYEFLAPVGTHALLSRNGTGAWNHWNVSSNAATLVAVNSGNFPAMPSARVSNIVFVTGGEPFANPDATPVFLGHVRDWTTSATGGGSNWNITSLTQGSGGLGNAATVNYKPVPAASHALVNQLRSNISIRTLEPGAGPRIGDVFITPAAGSYPPLLPGENFFISFSATDPDSTVFYRLSPAAAWTSYDPNHPPSITGNATVQAYAITETQRTPTRMAVYTFAAESPLTTGPFVDLDNDGMSDQWEDAFAAYDPNGDVDGDGSSNKSEFQNGTDPRDSASFIPSEELVLNADVVGNAENMNLQLSWPASNSTAVLQESSNLETWTNITTGISVVGSDYVYNVPLSGAIPPMRFLRLKRP